jgi:hypothetical protein
LDYLRILRKLKFASGNRPISVDAAVDVFPDRKRLCGGTRYFKHQLVALIAREAGGRHFSTLLPAQPDVLLEARATLKNRWREEVVLFPVGTGVWKKTAICDTRQKIQS